jgi:hypothetical protein
MISKYEENRLFLAIFIRCLRWFIEGIGVTRWSVLRFMGNPYPELAFFDHLPYGTDRHSIRISTSQKVARSFQSFLDTAVESKFVLHFFFLILN